MPKSKRLIKLAKKKRARAIKLLKKPAPRLDNLIHPAMRGRRTAKRKSTKS